MLDNEEGVKLGFAHYGPHCGVLREGDELAEALTETGGVGKRVLMALEMEDRLLEERFWGFWLIHALQSQPAPRSSLLNGLVKRRVEPVHSSSLGQVDNRSKWDLVALGSFVLKKS